MAVSWAVVRSNAVRAMCGMCGRGGGSRGKKGAVKIAKALYDEFGGDTGVLPFVGLNFRF